MMRFREMKRLRDNGRIYSYRISGDDQHWPRPIHAGLKYDVWAKPLDPHGEEALRREVADYLETEADRISIMPTFALPTT